MYKIVLNNGELYVKREIAEYIPKIKSYIETIRHTQKLDNTDNKDRSIVLNNINLDTFHLITDIIDHNIALKNNKNKTNKKIDDFFSNITDNAYVDFILATNYLGLIKLSISAANRFTNIIKNNSLQDIRNILKIDNDFAEKEYDDALIQNKWIDASDPE